MGDQRFQPFYDRIRDADRPVEILRALSDDEIVSALAACSVAKDPYIANVLATEAHNRLEERTRLERMLLESEERYRILAENVSDLLTCTDEEGLVTYASPASSRILGYAPDELEGRSAETLVHPEDWKRVAAARRAVVAGDENQWIKFRAIRKDGTVIWLESRTRAFDLGTGVVMGVVCVYREVIEDAQDESPAPVGSRACSPGPSNSR